MNPSAQFEEITPKMASAILEKHEKQITDGEILQRSLANGTVDRYANDMRHGHWVPNNQGIGFDRDDNLVDGRHRLWAVVRANVPVTMLVVRGMADSSKNGIVLKTVHTVDSGRTRNLAMQLHLDGLGNAVRVSAALRSIALLTSRTNQIRLSIPTAKTMLKLYERHLEKVADGLHNDPRMSAGYLVGTTAMYRSAEVIKADAFLESFYHGTELPDGSPVLALKTYIRTHGSRGGGTDRTIRAAQATALALMHYHTNTKVNTIRYSAIGQDWLLELQKGNTKKVRQILGVEADE
jgi:hypothetical protein